MLSYALGIGSFPLFITDAMDRNLGKLREMVRDRESWHAAFHGVAKSQILLGIWTSTTGNATHSWSCVSSDCFFFLFLSHGTSVIFISSSHTHMHTHTCTPPNTHHHPHTHTQISTQPQTQGTTLEYQRSLYRLLFPVLYMEDFSYISLKFWICLIKTESFICFFKPLFHIIFFSVAVISLWLRVKVRDHYMRRCHHEYYMR